VFPMVVEKSRLVIAAYLPDSTEPLNHPSLVHQYKNVNLK
jgi:hypothetical protein